MCSDPITTIDNQTGEELTFACRVCNDCLKARKNDWVARACAEKATTEGETLVFGLTYRNNEDGSQPDGAKVFVYKHVSDFLKRLRQAYHRMYKERGEVRFMVMGEKGSLNGRCHWHMILFATKPISCLGEWSDLKFNKIEGMRLEEETIWSLWPHGMLKPQVPDQGGMAYVLKYLMKDQFNVVKSKGTMREHKAEVHGASYFRMSKHPPIGQVFLERYCDEFADLQTVPINLNVKVPDYTGYWYPKREQRRYLLERLHQINEDYRETHGRDCPTWSSLLQTVGDCNAKDWEILVYGKEQEDEDADQFLVEEFEQRRDRIRHATQVNAIRSRCGGTRHCVRCRRGDPAQRRKRFRTWYETTYREYVRQRAPEGDHTFDEWFRSQSQPNPFCYLKDERRTRQAFEARATKGEFVGGTSARKTKAEVSTG